MQTPLGCAKAKGAGREENVLAGGARGRWRSRGAGVDVMEGPKYGRSSKSFWRSHRFLPY